MRLAHLGWIFLTLVVVISGVWYDSVFIAPKRASNDFTSRWIERFKNDSGDGNIPEDWKHQVTKRTLPSGEWFLTAMHHGSCAPGPEGTFDASVILDSSRAISYQNWSPCAGDINHRVQYWAELQPAHDLADFYKRYPKWTRVGITPH